MDKAFFNQSWISESIQVKNKSILELTSLVYFTSKVFIFGWNTIIKNSSITSEKFAECVQFDMLEKVQYYR